MRFYPLENAKTQFLKRSLLAGATVVLLPLEKVAARVSTRKAKKPGKKFPDLVGVKDGSPAKMFEAGIKALGGMERFVKPGQTVLVKPNIGWNKSPTEGANTNPDLVGKVIEMAYKSGAKVVNVFDNTCNSMKDCYKNSGIAAVVEKNKGVMHPSDKGKYYRTVKNPNAKVLKEAKVHNLFLDADVVINIPVLKSHMGVRMTAAIKNYMGVVFGRKYWHKNGLHECIADFPLIRRADLTVIDAYIVMMKNGPIGISLEDLELKKMQILATDMVLADTAAAKILNMNPNDIKYLKMAEKHGYGSMDLNKSKIKRISLRSKT